MSRACQTGPSRCGIERAKYEPPGGSPTAQSRRARCAPLIRETSTGSRTAPVSPRHGSMLAPGGLRGEGAAMTRAATPRPTRHIRLASCLRAACALVVGAAIGMLLTSSRAAAAPVGVDGVVVPRPAVLSAPTPAPSQGVWPLRPRPAVVARFHPPASRFGPGHRGVDLAGRRGRRSATALPGRVTYAGRLAGRGVVVVDHGSRRTTYEPVTASVHVGDRVAAGSRHRPARAVRVALLPARLPALGPDRGPRPLPRPAHARRRRPVRLLPRRRGCRPPVGAAGRRWSGARVGLAVGLPEPVGGDVGVDLRGRQ